MPPVASTTARARMRADAVLAALAEHVQGDPAGRPARPGVAGAAGPARGRARPAGSTGRGVPRRAGPAAPRRRWRRRRRARSGRRGGRPRGSASASRRGGGRTRRPIRISSRTRVGPSSTSTRTAAGSQSPTPAISVSAACAAGVSSGSSTAAMPPCAHRVEPSSMLTLVTTVTCRPGLAQVQRGGQPGDARNPTTSTSVVSAQPGAARGQRRGQRRKVDGRKVHPPVNPNRSSRGAAGAGRVFWATPSGARRATPTVRPWSLRPDRQTAGPAPFSEAVTVRSLEPQVAADAPVTDRQRPAPGGRTTTPLRKRRSASSGTPTYRARTLRQPS